MHDSLIEKCHVAIDTRRPEFVESLIGGRANSTEYAIVLRALAAAIREISRLEALFADFLHLEESSKQLASAAHNHGEKVFDFLQKLQQR